MRNHTKVKRMYVGIELVACVVAGRGVVWQKRFVSADDPVVAGRLLAENICQAQGMRLEAVTATSELYKCIDPGIVEPQPLEVRTPLTHKHYRHVVLGSAS
jgi:hypothetical protein